jgi:hypothetical protein
LKRTQKALSRESMLLPPENHVISYYTFRQGQELPQSTC